MINEEIIKNWGVPESIKDKDIEFIFDINNLNSENSKDIVIEGLYCDDEGSKFCLYDRENSKIIFTIDFFIPRTSYRRSHDSEKAIKLECLYTNDSEMRGKGIATYYLEKLIAFGISNDINKFKLAPNPKAKVFKNLYKSKTLSLKDLTNFYTRKFEKFGFRPEYVLGENDKLLQIIFSK